MPRRHQMSLRRCPSPSSAPRRSRPRVLAPGHGLALALALALTLALAACGTAPGPSGGPPAEAPAVPAVTPVSALEGTYDALPASACDRVAFDPAASSVRIYAFRDGRAARLGHNHVLTAPKLRGRACVGEPLTATRFDLVLRLDELALDDPAVRATLGPAFASVLSPEAIAGTREHLLGEDGLQADRFPEVRVRAVHVAGEWPRVAADVAVTLHGRTREMPVPLAVRRVDGRLEVQGSLALRQTDFGVRPYSVAGGLLAVRDEVVVEFTLVGR